MTRRAVIPDYVLNTALPSDEEASDNDIADAAIGGADIVTARTEPSVATETNMSNKVVIKKVTNTNKNITGKGLGREAGDGKVQGQGLIGQSRQGQICVSQVQASQAQAGGSMGPIAPPPPPQRLQLLRKHLQPGVMLMLPLGEGLASPHHWELGTVPCNSAFWRPYGWERGQS